MIMLSFSWKKNVHFIFLPIKKKYTHTYCSTKSKCIAIATCKTKRILEMFLVCFYSINFLQQKYLYLKNGKADHYILKMIKSSECVVISKRYNGNLQKISFKIKVKLNYTDSLINPLTTIGSIKYQLRIQNLGYIMLII